MSNELFSHVQPAEAPEEHFPEPLQRLFSQLSASDIAQFTTAYKLWTLHRQIDLLNLQIALKRQEIVSNAEQLHLVQPAALALSTLAQLQSNGVSDADLLDRLHTRGEAWLDHAIQLLAHCERMDLIQGDYTQWCEHALEGAYDWISSIDDDDLTSAENHHKPPAIAAHDAADTSTHYDEQAEALLLRKLFLEAGEEIPEEIEPAPELPSAAPSSVPSDDEPVHADALPDASSEVALPSDNSEDAPSLDSIEMLPPHESNGEALLSEDTDKRPALNVAEAHLPHDDHTTEETLSPNDVEETPSYESVKVLPPQDHPDNEEAQSLSDAASSPDLAATQQDSDLPANEQAELLASTPDEILTPDRDEPPIQELEESHDTIITEQPAEIPPAEEIAAADVVSDEQSAASRQPPADEEPVSVLEPPGEELISSDKDVPDPPLFVDAELPRAQKDQESTPLLPAKRIGLIARILRFFFPTS